MHQVRIAIKGLKEAGHWKKAEGEAVMVGTLEVEQKQHHHHQCQLFQGPATKIIYKGWRCGRPLCEHCTSSLQYSR